MRSERTTHDDRTADVYCCSSTRPISPIATTSKSTTLVDSLTGQPLAPTRRTRSASMSSSSTGQVSSLVDAAKRWNLAATDVSSWRARIMSSKTSAPPAPSTVSDPQSREQFLESLRLRQTAAEARLNALRSDDPAEAAAALDDDEEEGEDGKRDDEESEESSGSESGSGSGSDSSDAEEGEYENELEYYVQELLCVDAINHDPPSGKEGKCPYCVDGKKFETEFACSTCAFVRGVCASCRKVVVLRTLEDPAKGAAVCLALLSDPALLQSVLEPDDEEEAEGIRGQITFMLDAYFDKS